MQAGSMNRRIAVLFIGTMIMPINKMQAGSMNRRIAVLFFIVLSIWFSLRRISAERDATFL
jgi:hypothetical protein